MKFNFDNKLFVALGKVVDCAILSVLWLIIHGTILYST